MRPGEKRYIVTNRVFLCCHNLIHKFIIVLYTRIAVGDLFHILLDGTFGIDRKGLTHNNKTCNKANIRRFVT